MSKMSSQETLLEILKELQVGIASIAAIYKENAEDLISNEQETKRQSKKELERTQERKVLDLLNNQYTVTRHPDDMVTVAELTRYLILESEEFTPRQYDRILGRLFKSSTKKLDNKNVKMKIGIKKIQDQA